MSQYLPYAPIRCIETIIVQIKALDLIGEKDDPEYNYWYQWLYQIIGHLSEEEWKKVEKMTKGIKEIEHFTPHNLG